MTGWEYFGWDVVVAATTIVVNAWASILQRCYR